MLSNGTPWDTTAGEEVCVCWNLEPKASMHLRVSVSVSYGRKGTQRFDSIP